MKKIIIVLCLSLLGASNIKAQDIESMVTEATRDIKKYTDDQDKSDYNNLVTQLQKVYKDSLNYKFLAVTNFNFYQNNGDFIYAYNPSARVILMYFLNDDKAARVYMVRIDEKCVDCKNYITKAKNYTDWINSMSVLNQPLYEGYIANYIRTVLMFDDNYIKWMSKPLKPKHTPTTDTGTTNNPNTNSNTGKGKK